MPTVYIKDFKSKIKVSPENLKYQAERNALIPYAEFFADSTAGPKPGHFDSKKAHIVWAEVWNQTFFPEMDRLWKERG